MNDLSSYGPREPFGTDPIEGLHAVVEPMTGESRFRELFDAFSPDREGRRWEYLAYGPFDDFESFEGFARRTYLGPDMLFHAIVPRSGGRAEGVAALMRTDRGNGVTEIGSIMLAPSLARTAAATEAFFLIMRRVFDDYGFRRLEWKCDDRNQPSKRAALRLGFRPEGLFRQHMIVKSKNRDTAWFSIIDREWPELKRVFEAWLAPENFDREGRQKRSLTEIREQAGAGASTG